MLRKRRRLSESIDDDPMSGLNNLSDAMLVLALGFLIFAIMALSANPDMITQTQSTKDVSTADTFSSQLNYGEIIAMETGRYPLREKLLGTFEPELKERFNYF